MYQPLHLKYRPQILDHVIGQNHIVRILKNAIALNKIAPAYIMNGPKGTGKTSTARILAKSLNCQSFAEKTIEPCGKCDSCESIANSFSLNVTELDAASNSGVENIREIISTAQFAAIGARYKVYIIDECHALSDKAWNALLKTIENPPKSVVFIFCTTELYKVPETIISRCQELNFHKLKLNEVVAALTDVARKESINISSEALIAVASSGDGHMRDSLKLFDQLSLFSEEISQKLIWELSGEIPDNDVLSLIEYIPKGQIKKVIETLNCWVQDGKQCSSINKTIIKFLNALILSKHCSEAYHLTVFQVSTWNKLVQISQLWSQDKIQSAIALLSGRQNLMREESAELWLEASLIEVSSLENSQMSDSKKNVPAEPGKPVESSAPWVNWTSIEDAWDWAQKQLPQLSKNEIETRWQKIKPVNGKKASAWVNHILQEVQKCQ